MSSKSRKKSRQAPRKRQRAGGQASAAVEDPRPKADDDADELVHVPKEQNRLRFLLLIGLMVVLLIIFIVPGAIMNAVGRGGPEEDGPFVRWTAPDGDEVALSYGEWTQRKRGLSDALDVSPFLRFGLGFQDRTITEEEFARFLVLEGMAQESGLQVPDADLAAHLKQVLDMVFRGDRATYDRVVAQRGGAPFVESQLRRALRVQRLLEVAAYVGGVPDPGAIEEAWARDHEAFAFDFTSLEVASLVDEARADAPGDEELEAWFAGLDAFQTRPLMKPELRAAEFAVFRPGETGAEELLARHPAPEGTDPEERAKQYYDRVFYLRFRKPAEAAEGEEAAPVDYEPFEVVKEQAVAEAPVYFAMIDWLTALRSSSLEEGAPQVDLAAAAEELGLAYETTEGTVSREDLASSQADSVAGDTFANAVFQTAPEQFGATVVVRGDSLSVVRVTERVEPALPPLEEMRDEVLDLWAAERARELALERLSAIREGFGTEPLVAEEDEAEEEGEAEGGEDGDARYADADAFRRAVEAQGLVADWRDWLDKGAKTFAAPGLEPHVNDFFRSHTELYELGPGEVPEPMLDAAEEHAYLVRLAGSRPVGIEFMSPADYERYKSQAAMQVQGDLVQGLSYEFLAQRYDVEFARPKEAPDDDPEGAPEDAAE